MNDIERACGKLREVEDILVYRNFGGLNRSDRDALTKARYLVEAVLNELQREPQKQSQEKP